MVRLFQAEKEAENDDDGGSWIFTFADMVTLLFAFFVILYTMSKVDQDKYKNISDSLHQTFTGQILVTQSVQIVDAAQLGDIAKTTSLNYRLNKELNTMVEKINSFIYQENLQTKITTFIDDRGVVIKIADDVFFDAGSAEISDRSQKLLLRLMDLLQKFPYPMRIEGHTDTTPIHNEHYPSNWELSTSRACNVVKFFISSGLDPKLFSAEGFSEYRPIASNSSESGKSKNRRVELIFKKDQIREIIKNKQENTTEGAN